MRIRFGGSGLHTEPCYEGFARFAWELAPVCYRRGDFMRWKSYVEATSANSLLRQHTPHFSIESNRVFERGVAGFSCNA